MREHARHAPRGNALSSLLDRWQYRDDRYATAGHAMSPEIEEMVRVGRAKELRRLVDPEDRARANRVLERWSPPHPMRPTTVIQPEVRPLQGLLVRQVALR